MSSYWVFHIPCWTWLLISIMINKYIFLCTCHWGIWMHCGLLLYPWQTVTFTYYRFFLWRGKQIILTRLSYMLHAWSQKRAFSVCVHPYTPVVMRSGLARVNGGWCESHYTPCFFAESKHSSLNLKTLGHSVRDLHVAQPWDQIPPPPPAQSLSQSYFTSYFSSSASQRHRNKGTQGVT